MIRRATQADILKLSRLWFSMVKEMRPEWEPNPALWREHCFRFMQTGTYSIFISENGGGRIHGFIDYFLWPEPSTNKLHAVGQHFYMLPEFRKGKAAWELYRAATGDAISRGAKVLELFCFENELPKWERKGYQKTRFLVRREVGHV